MSEILLSHLIDRQPSSGKVIENLQRKYIQHRFEWGNATVTSQSEPILYPLRTRGIIAGLPSALNEVWKTWSIFTPLLLPQAVAEFFLISAGIKLWGVGKSGTWEPADYLAEPFIK